MTTILPTAIKNKLFAARPVFAATIHPLLRNRRTRMVVLSHLKEDLEQEAEEPPEVRIPAAFQAELGRLQLNHLDHVRKRKQELWQVYQDEIEADTARLPPRLPDGAKPLAFPVRATDQHRTIQQLCRHGVDASRGNMQDCTACTYLTVDRNCPTAAMIADQIVALPLYPRMGTGTARRVAATVNTVLG